MVLLYRDSQGETITTVNNASVIHASHPSVKKNLGDNEWEVKVSTLKTAMNDKDKTITELWEKIRKLTSEEVIT